MKPEWGRNIERFAGKYKMAKRNGAKPTSNMNTAIKYDHVSYFTSYYKERVNGVQ